VGKYGTNLEGFGSFEGGVNADKGAPLVSTSSDGETALLFGPAALREIQAGVANGDFAIPPDAAGDTITEENPLPYWTFTDVNSAGAITCAIVNDPAAGSTNVLRFTIASGTLNGKSVTITRFIPVPSSASRSFCFYSEATFQNATNSNQGGARLEGQYYKADQTTTTGSSWDSGIYTFDFLATAGTKGITAPDLYIGTSIASATAPADAAFVKLTITISSRIATASADRTIDLTEVRLANGLPELLLTDKDAPGTYQPAFIASSNGVLTIKPSTSAAITTSTAVTGDLTATGDIGFDGLVYATSAMTGPSMLLGGTNGRLWAFSNSSGSADLITSNSTTRAGVLITKPTAGQPSTNINGTATTDAFADGLRNGGIAVDTTNNRGYFYSSGWKYANLTTPSDSRLKEEITEISGALDTLRQLMPVAFKWKNPDAHGRSDCVADDGKRLGFIADQVATTDLAHWVETLGVDEREADLVDTTEVLAVNIPQNEMEALVVQALLDIDTRLKALEER
jgi:hypothetical protein